MKKFKIGFLPLTKENWTNDVMEAQRKQAREMLEKLDNVEVIGGNAMIDVEAKAVKELEVFEENRPDVIIAFYATFSLGTIVPLVSQRLGKVPVILWSIPEPDPAGGRLQANSFCATNMNAHFLWRFHIPYFSVHGNIGDDKTQASLERVVRIVRSIKKIKNLRIGSIGGRVPGFYTSCCSEMLLRDKIGSEVKTITMLEVVNEAKKLTDAEVDAAVELIKGDASCGVATKEEHVRKCAAMFAAIRKLKAKFGVSTFTMRCWPEIISDEMYGITACALIGHLTNHGDLTVCEGDVYAAVMLNLEKELSGIDPFFCDLIMCEDDSDYAVLWHCGAAPCSIRKEGYQSKLDFSSTVGGGGVKGVVHEFPLKPGKITLARLGETRDGSKFRMLIATGEGLDTDLFVRGNPLKVKFDGGCKKLKETVFNNGFEHHFSMAYGDISSDLLDFCRVMDIEPIVVK